MSGIACQVSHVLCQVSHFFLQMGSCCIISPGRHEHGAVDGECGHLRHEGRVGGVAAEDGGGAGADLPVVRQTVLAAVGLRTRRAGVLLLLLVAAVRRHVVPDPVLAVGSPFVLPQRLFVLGPDRTKVAGERSQLVFRKVVVPRHSRGKLELAAMASFLVLRQLAALVGDVVTLGAVERFRDHLHPVGQGGCTNMELVRGLPHSEPSRQGYSFHLLLHAEVLA